MIPRMTLASLWIVCASLVGSDVSASTEDAGHSTQTLSFLAGSWTVRRVYNPGSDREREIFGSLNCNEVLNRAYVFCRYEFAPADARPTIDDVYYNYNAIYGRFESVWMSATWPIKVILTGTLDTDGAVTALKTAADFPIENGVIEYVRDELRFEREDTIPMRFTRDTRIRTSEYDDGIWHHHMIETATRNR